MFATNISEEPTSIIPTGAGGMPGRNLDTKIEILEKRGGENRYMHLDGDDVPVQTHSKRKYFLFSPSNRRYGPYHPREIIDFYASGRLCKDYIVQKGQSQSIVPIRAFVKAYSKNRNTSISITQLLRIFLSLSLLFLSIAGFALLNAPEIVELVSGQSFLKQEPQKHLTYINR